MDIGTTKRTQTRKGTVRNRRKATHQVENLFFEISRPVEAPEMLRSWVEWFSQLRIPCFIAKTKGGYTLWRKGKEVGRRGSKSRPTMIKKDIVFSSGLTAMELSELKEE